SSETRAHGARGGVPITREGRRLELEVVIPVLELDDDPGELHWLTETCLEEAPRKRPRVAPHPAPWPHLSAPGRSVKSCTNSSHATLGRSTCSRRIDRFPAAVRAP